MSQDTKVKITEGSPLPYIAALLAVLSAVCMLINEKILYDAPIKFIIVYIVLPMLFCLLFAVFAAVLAKRIPQLMIIPIILISLCNILDITGISGVYLYGDWSILSYVWRYNVLETALKLLLMLLVLILGILAFAGIGSLPLVIVSAISIIANIVLQAWNYVRYGNFYVPWYLFYFILSLGAFITLALAIQNDKKYVQSPYSVPPLAPYPSPAPMFNPMAPGPQYQPGPAPVMGQPVMDQQTMGRPYMNQQAPVQNQAYNNPQNNMQLQGDTFEKINQLYEMNMKGIISNEEFEAKKKELLSKI